MTDRLAVFKGLLVSFELSLVSSEEMLPADIFFFNAVLSLSCSKCFDFIGGIGPVNVRSC